MTKEEAFRLRACRYQFVIKDPFPAHTAAEKEGPFMRLIKKNAGELPDISVHKAWQMGFDFAWDLIERRIKEMEPT